MNIKKFFDICSHIVNDKGLSVNWISPLGFPCRQPYRKISSVWIMTSRQRVSLTEKSDQAPVSKQKQRLGFPPNFIHSLDAAHLGMTAEKCRDKGITFAGVHDSFWTNACSVDEMSILLREAFVELHSQPILEDLRSNFQMQLGHDANLIPPIPPQGDLRLSDVMHSTFFFY